MGLVGGTVLVTGGAGYIGCVLVAKLLRRHRVVVLDACWFGRAGLDAAADASGAADRLEVIVGDIRDESTVDRALSARPIDAVIHLAAVANDPCSDLSPDLTRGVNLDAAAALMRAAKRRGVARFVNASSASVYGIKHVADVTEELPLEPLTLYARYKAETEQVLNSLVDDRFTGVSVRAATVCGWSPRLRLDLTINILTCHALTTGVIKVFGGDQLRPNVHVEDLADFYVAMVEAEAGLINRRAFNVVTHNASVRGLAEMVREHLSTGLRIEVVPTQDNRSYHLSADRARRELGFSPSRPLSLAVDELRAAFSDGRVPDPLDAAYRNIEVMKRFGPQGRPS